MTQLAKLEDYLEDKGLKKEDLTVEEAFRAGQIAFIASIADTLGVSLAYNGLQWVDEIGKMLKERKKEQQIEKIDLLGENYKKLLSIPKMDHMVTEDGTVIKI